MNENQIIIQHQNYYKLLHNVQTLILLHKINKSILPWLWAKIYKFSPKETAAVP